MTDPVATARALFERGDIDGAERALANAVLANGDDAMRAATTLLALCERRGELSFFAQRALDVLAARTRDVAVRDRVRALYVALGLDTAGVTPAPVAEALLPDLPDLDGFSKKPAEPETQKNARPQSLAEVAASLDDIPLATSSVFREMPHATTGAREIVVGKLVEDEDSIDTIRTPQPQHVEPLANVDASPKTPSSQKPKRASALGDVQQTFAPDSVVNDRYEVRSLLGKGGHATVLRVFDRELDEECALKVFHNTGDAADVARFKREVSISRKIVHENVVRLYDIGQYGGFYYLTMELLDGEDLGNTLKQNRTTMANALHWLVDACRGLQAAHDQGVVHRDVKPGNLFVLESGRVKVTDFGIAKPADALSLTSTGMFVGTPQYVSPEQVQGKDITTSADIYSLGVVAYYVLTGTLPFRDKEMLALLMKHANATPDRPRDRNPHIPRALDDLLMSCLAKDPADRPSSCADVAAVFESVLRAQR